MADDKYEKLHDEIVKIFPRAPFSISCINDISELDIEFSDRRIVLIVDDRAKYWDRSK